MRIFYGHKLTFSGLEKFLDNDWGSSEIRESSPIYCRRDSAQYLSDH